MGGEKAKYESKNKAPLDAAAWRRLHKRQIAAVQADRPVDKGEKVGSWGDYLAICGVRCFICSFIYSFTYLHIQHFATV